MSSTEGKAGGGRLIKAKDISIYGDDHRPEATSVSKNDGPENAEPGLFLQSVREVRLLAQAAWHQLGDVRARGTEILETSKAHSQVTVDMLKEEENGHLRAAFIGTSGLLGYALGSFGSSWRARILKRLIYTASAGLGAASFCYPGEAKEVSTYLAEESKTLGLIAYNFVLGAQPNNHNVEKVGKETSNQADAKG